jgi:hypothetical protein
MRRLIMLLAFITAFALPAQALARSREDVPNGPAGVHQYHRLIPTPEGQEPVPPETSPTSTAPSSQLPFTGEDVLLVVLTGLLLAGGGAVLYRQARQRS